MKRLKKMICMGLVGAMLIGGTTVANADYVNEMKDDLASNQFVLREGTHFVLDESLDYKNVNIKHNLNIGEFMSILEEKRKCYQNDPEFYKEADSLQVSCERLLFRKAMSAYSARLYMNDRNSGELYSIGNNGQILSANVALIQQTQGYNCGPTSALQVLYGLNRQNAIPGQNNAAKISQLESDCNSVGQGTIVYYLVQGINLYTTFADYAYYLATNMTQNQFQSKVETSLCYDMGPILHARTQYLGYYNGHSSGHYIAVSEINKINQTITLKDCNNNNSYYGQHVVSIAEAFSCIHSESGYYLICMNY